MSSPWYTRPFEIEPTFQISDWGKKGSDSLVAKLLPKFDPQLNYAELWVGAHHKAPALVLVDEKKIPLSDAIKDHPGELLGEEVRAKYGDQLPFLFKILSIKDPLSFQAHPNKEQAVRLHSKDPAHYPDSNHKPEVAIALTKVSALYGFRPLQDIHEEIARNPPLKSLALDQSSLEILYSSIVRSDETLRVQTFQALQGGIKRKQQHTDHEALFLRLSEQYPPSDIGLFTLFLLNFVTLEPGQGLSISPGIPHSYLSGELAECMANSDNVVRAGLTTKHQDVNALLEILDFRPELFAAIEVDNFESAWTKYRTPAEEFRLWKFSLPAGEQKLPNGGLSPRILFVLSGLGSLRCGDLSLNLSRGKAVFVPPGASEIWLEGVALHGFMAEVPPTPL